MTAGRIRMALREPPPAEAFLDPKTYLVSVLASEGADRGFIEKHVSGVTISGMFVDYNIYSDVPARPSATAQPPVSFLWRTDDPRQAMWEGVKGTPIIVYAKQGLAEGVVRTDESWYIELSQPLPGGRRPDPSHIGENDPWEPGYLWTLAPRD